MRFLPDDIFTSQLLKQKVTKLEYFSIGPLSFTITSVLSSVILPVVITTTYTYVDVYADIRASCSFQPRQTKLFCYC